MEWDSRRPRTWENAEEWLDATRAAAAEVRMDRQAGQETRLAVLSEAAGMVPQISGAVGSGPSRSIRQADSTHDHAPRIRETVAVADRPTEVLHLGDHDPSGAHMFLALAEDV